jgi:hypothetical protein
MEMLFSGTPEAEAFTHMIAESLAGVLAKNCHWPDQPGFVSASVDGRFWWDTMWTRDAGVFLREMAHWGHLEQALATLRSLFAHVQPNADGYRLFPEHFKPGQPAAGAELDGSAAILIGAARLWERLPAGSPERQEIWQQLSGPGSPTRGLLAALQNDALLAGSGEFGGGCGIPGVFYNVVQNNLARLALLAVARLAEAQRVDSLAEACRQGAERLLLGMLAELRDPTGAWLWCRRAPDRQLDRQVLDHPINAGFGGLNGVLAMSSDVFGPLLPLELPWIQPSLLTFLKLLSQPNRLRQFASYGIWTQFDHYLGGYLTSPSYGHGYAVQAMQLLDRPELYTPAVNWLVRATLEPLPGQELQRASPYWIYERYYSPEAVGKIALEEGCGALNLVCVMEPLKIARLMLGLDERDPTHLRLVPRLPIGWRRLQAWRVPVLTPSGLAYAEIEVQAARDGAIQAVWMEADRPLPGVEARLGRPQQPDWQPLTSSLRSLV